MLVVLTILESVYLFYMFFLFKTKQTFGPSLLDLQSHSSFFIHDTGAFENKVCLFGKVIAVIAILLALTRAVINNKSYAFKGTIAFDFVCIIMAAFMNLNAFIYIIPLILTEAVIIHRI